MLSTQVTVVLINFNGAPFVFDCLKGLASQQGVTFKLVVVDNASTDGSAAEIARRFPLLTLHKSEKNLGFAGGVNLALDLYVDTPWFALINPDAIPDASWLYNLISATNRHPGSASFASHALSMLNPALLDGTGDVYHASGIAWRRGFLAPAAQNRHPEGPIFSACAAAALYNTQAVRDVGAMDCAFFCYFEDVDLGFRLRLAGYDCIYVPSASVRHIGSAVSGQGSDFQIYHGHRNLVWSFVKNIPGPLLPILIPLHLMMTLVVVIKFSLSGRARSILRAKRDAIKGIMTAWEKRKPIQASRQQSSLALVKMISWGILRR